MMQPMLRAARAYQAAATHRSLRAQQADLFRQTNGALQAGKTGSQVVRARAVAENRQLWGTVVGLMYDPANPLPASLRGSIVSIGLAVQREMDRSQPDFDFLISVNENLAAGLANEN